MKFKKKKQWLEEMKNWTKKTMVEEDERLNKVKLKKIRKDVNEVVQKEIKSNQWDKKEKKRKELVIKNWNTKIHKYAYKSIQICQK